MTDKAIQLLKAAVAEAQFKANSAAKEALNVGEPHHSHLLNRSKEWTKAANETAVAAKLPYARATLQP